MSTGRSAIGYGEVLAAIEAAFEQDCEHHGPFVACTKRSEHAAVAVLDALRSLPVEQRMTAMGMRALRVHSSQEGQMQEINEAWVEAK